MKVSAILKGRTDNQGRKKVYIRVNDGKKRTFKVTNMRVHPTDWNGKVKTSHPDHELFNRNIKRLLLNTEVSVVEKTFDKFSDADFFAYCTRCLNEWDKAKSLETIRQHKSEINKMEAFAPVLKLSQVTPDFLIRYKDHLYKIGNKTNTVWKSIKFLRTIILKAHRERLIEYNPFHVFEMPKYKDPKKIYLSRQQIELIEKFLSRSNTIELKLCGHLVSDRLLYRFEIWRYEKL